jgi:UDP-N-acetylglucosamine enolpyruvyl transferase
VNNVHYIDRGYEKIEERLRDIGVDIKRVNQ